LRLPGARFSRRGSPRRQEADDGAALSFRSQKVAILFVDLRGFTSLAEQMPAVEVANFLNEYRRRIAVPITRHHGKSTNSSAMVP
jgi:adenylate cyclase